MASRHHGRKSLIDSSEPALTAWRILESVICHRSKKFMDEMTALSCYARLHMSDL